MRSIPIPNANPVYFLLSMLQLSKTLGSTIPQPRISTHHEYLQILHPLPPQILRHHPLYQNLVNSDKNPSFRLRATSISEPSSIITKPPSPLWYFSTKARLIKCD